MGRVIEAFKNRPHWFYGEMVQCMVMPYVMEPSMISTDDFLGRKGSYSVREEGSPRGGEHLDVLPHLPGGPEDARRSEQEDPGDTCYTVGPSDFGRFSWEE